ncbi:YqaE/Pmp3 family membrane protein [Fulvivirga kasyanovii]|uniref:YqaE/Pmp3 family membrane protein n=1 Tax=Fulvivirga kasyanovii TaxID=396812 RepID=A0ABW9RY80_9BACT|nr:YqaE/Pmp3 family membrane protein [Fulvivirga kasyanovii]MTI28918.1 YqaE/Pmp3 family membrane protein [Fulvivirga kasyanovii]
MSILMIILTLLLPPLAVAIRFGVASSAFLINLLLTLLGWLPGVIHGFWIQAKKP